MAAGQCHDCEFDLWLTITVTLLMQDCSQTCTNRTAGHNSKLGFNQVQNDKTGMFIADGRWETCPPLLSCYQIVSKDAWAKVVNPR